MTDRESKLIDEMTAAFYKAVENVVESAAANVLKRFEETKGDSISQRQAEREFGKKWLHDHLKVMGRELYVTGAFNGTTGSRNQKRLFSRAQLAEIRRKETDITVYQKFACRLYALERGAMDNIFDDDPIGIREMRLQQRLDEKIAECDIITDKLCLIDQERQQRADSRKRNK